MTIQELRSEMEARVKETNECAAWAIRSALPAERAAAQAVIEWLTKEVERLTALTSSRDAVK